MRAGLIVVFLVLFAAVVGVVIGTRARPTPVPRPAPSPTTIVLPVATPADPAEVQRRAFAQPLVTGCATDRAVWLFADGGSAIRFDGRAWTIPDPTLRSLIAAACRDGTALAVGRAGSILTVDDDRRELRVDRVGTDDLNAVVMLPRVGAVAAGAGGLVVRQGQLDWASVGPATEQQDLFGIAVEGDPFAPTAGARLWTVGTGGMTLRLTGTWSSIGAGDAATAATLRGVAIGLRGAIAVGDRGRVFRYVETRGWASVDVGTDVDLRAVSVVAADAAWIVGDRGTVIELLGDAIRRIDLGTTCTLRAVFPQGSAVWIVGSDGLRGGAWRVAPEGTDRWGTC